MWVLGIACWKTEISHETYAGEAGIINISFDALNVKIKLLYFYTLLKGWCIYKRNLWMGIQFKFSESRLNAEIK